MLNARQKIREFDARSRSLSELLPWLLQVTPGLVLNKDGSLQASYHLQGMTCEAGDVQAMDWGAQQLEQAFRAMDARVTIWLTVLRKGLPGRLAGQFPEGESARMNVLYQDTLASTPLFYNRVYLTILLSPARGAAGFWSGLAEIGGTQPTSPRKWVSLLTQRFLHGPSYQHDEKALCRRIFRFEEMLSLMEGALQFVRPDRLQDEMLIAFLGEMTSPASHEGHRPKISDGTLLDGLLGEDRVTIHADHVRFEGIMNTLFGGVLALKGWPGETWPGMLNDILAVPGELVFSQVFRFVDQEEAKRYIKNVQRFHLNFQKSLFSYVREALSGEESVVRDTGRTVLAHDAREALTDMAARNRVFGYHNLALLVTGRSMDEMEACLSSAANVIRARGYLLLRERMHLTSAWSGTLPGQWGELVRWHFVSTANWADLCPLRHEPMGQKENAYLKQQMGRAAPALALFSTPSGGSYFFNLHHQDLAHAFVVGPSRSGKSVFVNFLISQYQKYHPVRTVIFDKDRSCRIATLLQDGTCVDMGRASVQLNPLFWLSSASDQAWLTGWLELLLTARGYAWTAQDDQALAFALSGLAIMAPEFHRLSCLHALLPGHLGQELEPWLEGGALGGYFDHRADQFSLSAFTCIEMSDVLQDRRITRAFLDYVFFRIEKHMSAVSGTPTLIYVEEAWFMLSDPYFSRRLRDWLKTIPKKLGSVILATQSLDDLSSSDIFSAIADNIPTRIFLPNRNAQAHEELYKKQFGLNGAQVSRIEQAIEKRQYYIQSPSGAQLVEAVFSKALLARLRSDALGTVQFERHYSSQHPQWKERYLEDVLGEAP